MDGKINWQEEFACFSDAELLEAMEDTRVGIEMSLHSFKVMESELQRRHSVELPPTVPDVNHV